MSVFGNQTSVQGFVYCVLFSLIKKASREVSRNEVNKKEHQENERTKVFANVSSVVATSFVDLMMMNDVQR